MTILLYCLLPLSDAYNVYATFRDINLALCKTVGTGNWFNDSEFIRKVISKLKYRCRDQ